MQTDNRFLDEFQRLFPDIHVISDDMIHAAFSEAWKQEWARHEGKLSKEMLQSILHIGYDILNNNPFNNGQIFEEKFFLLTPPSRLDSFKKAIGVESLKDLVEKLNDLHQRMGTSFRDQLAIQPHKPLLVEASPDCMEVMMNALCHLTAEKVSNVEKKDAEEAENFTLDRSDIDASMIVRNFLPYCFEALDHQAYATTFALSTLFETAHRCVSPNFPYHPKIQPDNSFVTFVHQMIVYARDCEEEDIKALAATTLRNITIAKSCIDTHMRFRTGDKECPFATSITQTVVNIHTEKTIFERYAEAHTLSQKTGEIGRFLFSGALILTTVPAKTAAENARRGLLK